MSERTDLGYNAELLASYGYVVVAANFPLTAGGTAGGPNANDLVNQPSDVSFLIDSVLQLSGEAKSFAGEIDSSRIALMGYSLGRHYNHPCHLSPQTSRRKSKSRDLDCGPHSRTHQGVLRD